MIFNRTKKRDPTTGRASKEYCTPIARPWRRKRSERDKVAGVAGWRGHGFRAHRPSMSTTVSVMIDGQEFHKPKRASSARRRKMVCRLATSAECRGVDPKIEAERRRLKPRRRARRKAGKSS